MNVSFHGVKNVGSYHHTRKSTETITSGGYVLELPKGRYTNIHVELNNKNGNDLDAFKEILEKYPNFYNKSALNFSYDYFKNEQTGKTRPFFTINGKQIELNNKNLPVINKIFKLMKKISKMDKEELKVENSYIKSPEADAAFEAYKLYAPEKNYEKILDIAHTRYYAQTGASYLAKKLEHELTEFVLS